MDLPYIKISPKRVYYFKGNFQDGTYLIKIANGRVFLFIECSYDKHQIVIESQSWKRDEIEGLVNLPLSDDSRWFIVEPKKALAILRRHRVSIKDAIKS